MGMMKIYNNLLANYLLSRRNGDHSMAFQLAGSICGFWFSHDDAAELEKWRKVQAEHHAALFNSWHYGASKRYSPGAMWRSNT